MEMNASAPVTSSQPTAPSDGLNAPTTGGSSPEPKSQGSTGSNQSGLDSGSKAKTSPAPQSNEMYEVTVNGKVKKMTLQELKDHASMSHAAQQRFEEAAKIRKENEKFRETAKKNFIEALQDPSLGLTKDQIRSEFEKWYTREFIEPETLTPEQKKSKELEEKLRKYEEAEQEKKRQEEEAQEQELTNKEREYLQGQIIDALDRSGLPKTPLIAARMAFYMRENLLKGWDAPIDLIVKQVKQERQQMMSGEVGALDGEDLINYLGEDLVNKIRRYDLQRLREKRSTQAPSFNNKNSDDGYGNEEKINYSEVQRRLRDLRTGKRTF